MKIFKCGKNVMFILAMVSWYTYVKTYKIVYFRYAVYCALFILQSCKENG